jgi:hypothetical protein
MDRQIVGIYEVYICSQIVFCDEGELIEDTQQDIEGKKKDECHVAMLTCATLYHKSYLTQRIDVYCSNTEYTSLNSQHIH